MSVTKTNDVSTLAHEAMVKSLIPTATIPKDEGAPVCQPGDKECVSRWIQAFSDCD